MKRSARVGTWLAVGFVFVAGLGSMQEADAAGGKKSTAASADAGVADPPVTKDPVKLLPEGLKFGQDFEEVANVYDRLVDEDFRAKLAKVQPGVKMKAIEAAAEELKLAFRRTRIDFGENATGIDQSALFGEYHYKNSEAMMKVTRGNTTRFFFFYSGKLYKLYDQITLGTDEALGGTFPKALGALYAVYGSPGRQRPHDAVPGHHFPEYDWVDNVTHVRVLDRGSTSEIVVVYEDRAVASRLDSLPPAKSAADMLTNIDPSIQAIMRGDGGTVDPNASAIDSFTGHTQAPPAASSTPPKRK